MTKEKITRKNSKRITVYCLPEEQELINAKAAAANLSASKYLLNVGQGYPIKSILDHKRVNDLAKINGDLGRLGGLLKLWLTNDEKLLIYDPEKLNKLILDVLTKIEANQDELRKIMKGVVRL